MVILSLIVAIIAGGTAVRGKQYIITEDNKKIKVDRFISYGSESKYFAIAKGDYYMKIDNKYRRLNEIKEKAVDNS